MVKRYSEETFKAVVNGVEYVFDAYTTDTRNGFCHTIVSKDIDITDTKVSYSNRTWERFRYETALSSAFDKVKDKALRDELRAQIIDKTYNKVHEECEAFTRAFSSAWGKLNEKSKEVVRNTFEDGIQSEEEANMALGMASLLGVMQ